MIKRIQILLLSAIIAFLGSLSAQEIIPMKKESSGIYTLPCEINNLKLRFILDTGASAVSISLTEATFMLKNGYLDENDIIGTTNVQTADGKIAENHVIKLREVKIGSVILKNIEAIVSSGLDAPLLLGQSVLGQLGHWAVKDNSLILNDHDDVVPEFDNVSALIQYCKTEYRNGSKSKALRLLQNYENGNNIDAQIAYVDLIRKSDNDSGYIEKCIDSILIYKFENPEDQFNALNLVARSYNLYFDDEEQCVELYEWMARNNRYDKTYRYKAYESLYLIFMDSNPSKANSYALEALNQGMYELTMWYCDYYLLENNMTEDAFKWYIEGYCKGEIRSSYGLGRGYLRGIWSEKNVAKGLEILTSLAEYIHYADAVYELCDYYWNLQDYDKMIKTARLFDEKDCDTHNIYEALGYYNQKNYSMLKNRLECINPSKIRRTDLNCQYYYLYGKMYMDGLGVAPNLSNALDYFTILAEKDAGWGYSCLGDLHISPLLEYPDYKSAYHYYLIGANNNDGYCCYQIAILHKHGLGTYQSDDMSKIYLKKAQELGIDTSGF